MTRPDSPPPPAGHDCRASDGWLRGSVGPVDLGVNPKDAQDQTFPIGIKFDRRIIQFSDGDGVPKVNSSRVRVVEGEKVHVLAGHDLGVPCDVCAKEGASQRFCHVHRVAHSH